MPGTGAHVDFSPESTVRLLVDACTAVGLDPAGAELMRLGENAIYGLSTAPVVVRIARSVANADGVRTEMRVARWLAAEGYPAARLAEVSDQESPLIIAGHAVTFWQRVIADDAPPTRADLARLLRELHSFAVPKGLNLPPFNPFGRIPERIEAAPPVVSTTDREFLRDRTARLMDEFAEVRFPDPPCAVHGDAHPGNLLRDSSGTVVLLDFEAFCFGPRQWDLIPTAAYRHGMDSISDQDYQAFVDAYGWDVSEWEGFPTLRAIREMGMTTWLMQMAGHDPAARVEFDKRISDLRSGRFPRRWRKF